MHLKSLEILGFKSFAPKTILNFDRGVTCVVGPNGCGKSNVLDAIRWVLGEQSAKALRGGEMTDVIFSGTDSRQAMGMAEVSMTFTECEEALGLDYHEVTVTRRVFREGGSEYLLNNTPCRLKDIHQLFMDTGIGRTAYSIMEQGKIDQILSSRPEDRRAIFEEAAGITKYKSQRKEALRKLEATEANFIRLHDILKEVKRQIGSVQRQAAKAKRYQTMLDDLRVLELHNTQRQWKELDESRLTTLDEIQHLNARQYEGEREIETLESEANACQATVEEMDSRIGQARQSVQELRQRVSNHENRLAFNAERSREFETHVERYHTDIAGAEEKTRIVTTQLHDTDTELEQITTLLAGELRRLEDVQARVAEMTSRRQEADRSINEIASELGKVESRLHSLRSQLSGVTQQRESAEARLAMIAGEAGSISESIELTRSQYSSAQGDAAALTAQIEERTAVVGATEAKLRESREIMAQIEKELREAQRLLHEKDSRLGVLKQLHEGGEGFSEGTQAVLAGLDNPDFYKAAIHGALAQCIEVDPEYVTAVEAILGTNLQAIIMKDTMVAEAVVKKLTDQQLGRASLVLRDLEPVFEHVTNELMLLPHGAIDWLINKIKPQTEVARVVERIINHTVLVADLETALRIFPHQRGSAIVTLAGEVITGNGILHGGSGKGNADSSFLQRRNQITTLEQESTTCGAQVAGLQARYEEAATTIINAEADIQEAHQEKQNAVMQLSSVKGQLAAFESQLREVEKKQQSLDWEQQSAEARRVEALGKSEQQEAEIRNTEELMNSLLARRSETQSQVEILRAQEGEIVGELNELKIKVATERQRHSSLHSQRQPLEARAEELTQLITTRRADIATYEERTIALTAENAELQINLENLAVTISESEQTFGLLVEERTSVVAGAQALSDKLRQKRRDHTHVMEQRGSLEVRRTQLELKSNAIADHIQKRYQLEIADFVPDSYALYTCIRELGKRIKRMETSDQPAEGQDSEVSSEEAIASQVEESEQNEAQQGIDWLHVEALVKELDSRLSSMGPVNLDAIAEYEELEQRNSFLEQQVTDTEKAKEELLEVINKINQTTKILFAETFEQVRQNFQDMFKELFGGGQANLILSDETDPLECGIEIVAKPPGKQLSNITLLSGGEKTMTAVALLFSIYMVKPSPFCVLDEMDAPLDESNITRFIKILDRFVGQSQFVVISHNKRTIARADALYGVTMEEHGVSKLVGVKFRSRDESSSSSDILGNVNATPIPSVAESFGKTPKLHSETLEEEGRLA